MKSAEEQAAIKYPMGIGRDAMNSHKRIIWLDGYRAGQHDIEHLRFMIRKQAEDLDACHKIIRSFNDLTPDK